MTAGPDGSPAGFASCRLLWKLRSLVLLLVAAATLAAIDVAPYPWPSGATPIASAFDSEGNLYVSGYSTQLWGELKSGCAVNHAFVVKMSLDRRLQWVYCLAVHESVTAMPLNVDANGSACFTLGSRSPLFKSLAGDGDGFGPSLNVAALEPSGELRFGRSFANLSAEGVRIGVDAGRNIYVSGPFSRSGFQQTAGTVNSDAATGQNFDGSYLVKLRADGSEAVYRSRPVLRSQTIRDIAVQPGGSVLAVGVGVADEGASFFKAMHVHVCRNRGSATTQASPGQSMRSPVLFSIITKQ